MNYDVYYDYNSIADIGIGTWIISIAASVLIIVSMWKIFKKAGKKGWESIIPIYNMVVLLEICKIEVWQIVFFIIPFANIYIFFRLYIELAKKFGKGVGFGVLNVFFPIITLPILAFGSAKYEDDNNSNTESNASILDVSETGVPNNSEAKDFEYGYEKEETVVIPQINEDENSESSSNENEDSQSSSNQE